MFKEPVKLSADVDWMLQSPQASDAMVIEAVAKSFLPSLLRLALTLLDDPDEARIAVEQIFAGLPEQRRAFRADVQARDWLFAYAIRQCTRLRSETDPKELVVLVRRKVRAVNRRKTLSPLPRSTWARPTSIDTLTWDVFDQLGLSLRLPMILHYNFGMSVEEIGRVVNCRPGTVRSRLTRGFHQLYAYLSQRVCAFRLKRATGNRRDRIWHGLRHRATTILQLERLLDPGRKPVAEAAGAACEQCSETAAGMAVFDRNLARSLQKRWSEEHLPALSAEELIASALERRRRKPAANPITSFPAKLGMSAVILLAFGAALWVNSGLIAQQVPPATATRRVTPTAIAPTLTPTPNPISLQKLSPESSPREILHRMDISQSIWESVQMEAVLLRTVHTTSDGLVEHYRVRLWASNTGDRLALAGPATGPAESASYQQGDRLYQVDLNRRQSHSGSLSKGEIVGFLDPWDTDRNNPLDGNSLAWAVFPGEVPWEEFSLQVEKDEGVILGRKAVVINLRVRDASRYRLWIDQVTGIILRWQRFSAYTPSYLLHSMTLTDLEFGVPFPIVNHSDADVQRWLSDGSWKEWDPELAPEEALLTIPLPVWISPPNHVYYPQVPPPLGFDLAQSRLFFQWEPQTIGLTDIPGRRAEIYAGEYYLGEVELGNPLTLICQRSPDGMYLAFTDPSAREQGVMVQNEGPIWLSLSDPEAVHQAFPDGTVAGSDFAFSPNSKKLAFWGCSVRGLVCGIFVHDLASLETRLLSRVKEQASFLAYSHAGDQLAMITADNTFTVIDALTGELLNTDGFNDLVIGKRSLESSMSQWGEGYPPRRSGLAGCVEAKK